MIVESAIKADNKREKITFLQYLITSFLWTEAMHPFLQYFFLLGVNIQYMAILYWGQFEFALNSNYDDILGIIHKICKAITFQTAINPDSTLGVSLALNSVAWGYLFIFLLIFGLIGRNYMLKREIPKRLGVFINLATCFHEMIGFWITNIILMNAIKLAQDSELWSNTLLAINIINLVMIVLNYAVGVLSAVVSYDPLSTMNPLSSHTPVFQTLTFLLKAFLAPVLKIYGDVEFAGWYFAIIAFIMSFSRYAYLLRNYPYYNYMPMRISISFCSAALVSSVASIIALGMKSSISNEPQSIFPIIYIQAMVIPLLSKFGTTYLENSILKFGERKNSSLTTEIDVLKKMFALNYLIKKTSNTQDWSPRVGRSDLQLWGIVASQSQPEEDLAEKFAFENLAHAASLRLLLESMRRMKGNIKLKMIFASHMSNDNSTISAALASLAEIPTNIGISQFIAIKLHRRLQEKLHDLHNVREGVLDIRRYVDQTMKKTQFNKLIHNTGTKFADFWDTYRQSDLKVIDLFRKCEVIEIYDKRVKDYWMKYIEPEKSLACSLSLLYSIYLSLIRNAPYTAMKISESHPSFNPNKNLDQETAALSEANFFSSRNMSFTISMSREKLGRVLYMSPNVPELIGWTKYDLIGHNINRVLPNDMKEQHNLILQKHLHGLTTHTRKPKMYRNLTSHLINKAGQVLPCNTYIAVHPYVQQELVYIGFVKLTSKPRTRTMPASENFADTETSKQFTMVLKKGPPASNEPTNYDILPSYTGVSQGLLPSYDPMESLPTQAQRSRTRNQTTIPDPQRTMGRETTLGLPANGDQSFGYQENAEGGNGDMNFSLGIPDEETRNDRTRTDDDMSYIPDERAIQEKIIISASGYPAGGYSPLLEKKQKEALLSKFSQYGSRTITKDKREEPSSEYSAKQNLNSLSMHVSAQEKSQKKNIQRIVDLDGSVTGSLTSNRSSAKNYMSKLEQGIYVVPKLPQIRNFRLLVFSLIVVAIALLVFFGLDNTKVLDSIQGNVQVLSESTLRLFRIVDVNRLTRTFALVGLGYMTKDRYNEFAPGIDSRIILLSSFTSSTNQLNTYNNEVRNSLHLIAPSLQQKFYETQIPYNDLVITATGLSIELMGYANMFDLTTILIASADAIIATPIANYDSVTFGNTNVNLIVLNSLNELLVSGEEILTILQQDNDQKFQTEINTFIIVTIIIGVLCCLLFGYFYSLERILLKKRDRIIDIFLRLDEKLLESRTSMVHKFKTSLEKDYFDVRKLDLSFGSATSYPHMSVKKAAAKEMNTGIYKRKRANLLGLNLPVLTMNIYTITLLFMVLLAFLVLLVITIEQSSSVTQKVELMQQSNLNLYNINLAFSIMYEYIYSSKGSTVHNNPITEEWERSYQYISKSQSNFLNLINQDSSVANSEEVNQYLKGNLCELIGGVGIEAQCIAFGGGALTKGIIGGVSIMVSTMSSVIQNYDSSSGSAADIVQVLNNEDLIGLDVIAAAYLFPAFEQIASFIKTRILENIDDATNHFMAIVIVFIVLYIIGGYLLWKKIESMFKRERGGWRRMLRLVPQTVVNNNKMLKDFLLANSDGIMESIKRHLH